MNSEKKLTAFNRGLETCRECPRLVKWRETVGREKKTAFSNEAYWARPVPSIGDAGARILLVGLAPGAHGANRTGRPFTGDGAGNYLYPALFRTGLSNQEQSIHRNDGLKLKGAYLANVVRCVPPGNRPTTGERDRCVPNLAREIELLGDTKVIVALGGFAWDGVLRALVELGHPAHPKPRFGHGREVGVGPYVLLGMYHPSQLNTHTGRLTRAMIEKVFRRARTLAGLPAVSR